MSFRGWSPDHGCFCFLELGHTKELPGISNVTFPTCGCFPACLSHERRGGSSSWLLGISVRGWQRAQSPEVSQTSGPPASIPSIWLCLWGFPQCGKRSTKAPGEGWGDLQWLLQTRGSPGMCSGLCQSQHGDQRVLALLSDNSPSLLSR